MNIDEHIKATEHLLACQKAFNEGKKILFQGVWLDDKPSWSAHPLDYSIAPEPKLRPWKPEEVPFGAIARPKHDGCKKAIFMVWKESELLNLLALSEWCWPHEQFDEKAWKPCGVAE